MKHSVTNIIVRALLSVLVIIASIGVARLPHCCLAAGECLAMHDSCGGCHNNKGHDHTNLDHQSDCSGCVVSIDRVDLFQFVDEVDVPNPLVFFDWKALLVESPIESISSFGITLADASPHSPPDKVGRVILFSIFII